MAVARSAENPTFELGGNRVTGLASPGRGASETILYRVDVPAGGVVPLHLHDHEEVYHVVAGAVTSILGDARIPVEAGDTVMIPPGTLHNVEAGEAGATILAAMPAGTLFIPEGGEGNVPPWGA